MFLQKKSHFFLIFAKNGNNTTLAQGITQEFTNYSQLFLNGIPKNLVLAFLKINNALERVHFHIDRNAIHLATEPS